MEIKWQESFGKPSRINLFFLFLTSKSSTLIWESSIEMPLKIKLHLKQPKPSKNARLASSAPPLLLMRLELRNLTWRVCGKVQTEPSETFLEELSSENPLSSRTSQGWFLDGKSQSLLEDMPLEINTKQLTLLLISLEHSKYSSRGMTELKQPMMSTNIKEREELALECITQIRVLKILHTAASSSPYLGNILFI